MDNKENKENNWHLTRGVSIGHIVTTAAVAIGAIMYLGDIKEDVAVNSTKIANNTATIEQAATSNHDMFKRIDTNMSAMNTKIDDLYKLLLSWDKK